MSDGQDGRLELLTRKQVAQRLRVGVKTLDRLVERGHLAQPRRPGGGQPRWFAGDVDTYLWRLARGDFDPQVTPNEAETGQSESSVVKGGPKVVKGGQAPKRPSQDDPPGD